MTNSPLAFLSPPQKPWQMPIVPEHYNRSPLSEEEWRALEPLAADILTPARNKETDQARRLLARLNRPIMDVFALRHKDLRPHEVSEVFRIIRREMYHRHSTFWEWTLQEWVEILCPTAALFRAKWGKQRYRTTLLDIAYLLGGIVELPLAGVGVNFEIIRVWHAFGEADPFEKEKMPQQSRKSSEKNNTGQENTNNSKREKCISRVSFGITDAEKRYYDLFSSPLFLLCLLQDGFDGSPLNHRKKSSFLAAINRSILSLRKR